MLIRLQQITNLQTPKSHWTQTHATNRCGSRRLHCSNSVMSFKQYRALVVFGVLLYGYKADLAANMRFKRTAFLFGLALMLHAAAATSATSGSLFHGQRTRSFNDPGTTHNRPGIGAGLSKTHVCAHYAVVTTIFEPSAAVNVTCSRLPDWCLVIVADKKGPPRYRVDGPCAPIYLSVDDQEALAATSDFVAGLPWNHFGRKNVGYLYAILHGATAVWDFDDDNELLVPTGDLLAGCAGQTPHRAAGTERRSMPHGRTTGAASCTMSTLASRKLNIVNPYPLLGATHFSWPRGFPLQQINNSTNQATASWSATTTINTSQIGVVQSLANHNPDVDAIYRLTRPLPLDFARDGSATAGPLVLPEHTFAPFNAQATLFHSAAVWALYLPVTVHGRVSDIWRSYIAQRLMWDAGLLLAFDGPWVRQIRNKHNIIADLDSEMSLYLRTEALLQFLGDWRSSAPTLAERIVELYMQLYEREYVEHEDVVNVGLWVRELTIIRYAFPGV